jgi:hypothetical protein
MDRNMVGPIGEAGGAIGVIVTLIQLAGQLEQNTNAPRSASYEHWNTQVAECRHYQGQHAKELAEMRKADSLTHPMKEVDAAALAVATDSAQVVQILDYAIAGRLS